MDQSPRCTTNLIDDIPAIEDAFATDDGKGPHERVADAIEEIVRNSDSGGKAIGLEGGWGSGKSTVINFLRNRFSDDNDLTVILFDAWAHEGDPLRRTFLENVIKPLQRLNWVSKPNWDKAIEKLANRSRETTTTITPSTTMLGKLIAVSLLLVPAGSPFVASGLRDGATIAWGLEPHVPFIAGLCCVFAPFLVFSFYALFQFFSWIWRWCSGAEVAPEKSNQRWKFLVGEAVQETNAEVTETPDPTSLEFEASFDKLMDEALTPHKSRRLLFVLDNLDRVDAETGKHLWGTLQTFLRDRNSDAADWFKQLWFVVPYDPSGIETLWSLPSSPPQDGSDPQPESHLEGRPSQSFVDKSFQVRFQVAPPVLSDWKSFLQSLFCDALPAHQNEKHGIYQVYEYCRRGEASPPTPREIKLFVNQIGAIHRQWEHEFPLQHVAFYVQQHRKHGSLVQKLRTKEFPKADAVRAFGADLKKSLAGLAFNTKPQKGFEILLADPIYEASSSAKPNELRALADAHGLGFWSVLERVANTRFIDCDVSTICSVSRCLLESNLFDGHEHPEQETVRQQLEYCARSRKDWAPFTEDMSEGLCSLLQLQADDAFTKWLTGRLRFGYLSVKHGAEESDTPTPTQTVSDFVKVIEKVRKLEHDDALKSPFSLSFDAEGWIEACNELRRLDPRGRKSRLFNLSKPKETLSAHLVAAIAAGELTPEHRVAIQITEASPTKMVWSEVTAAIASRLAADVGVQPAEATLLQLTLMDLCDAGSKDAIGARDGLANPGHICHHYETAVNSDDDDGQAIALVSYLSSVKSTAKQPTAVGTSAAGYTKMKSVVESPERETCDALYQSLERYDLTSKIFEIADWSETYSPLLIQLLRCAADSKNPTQVFTARDVIDRWSVIRRKLNDKTSKDREKKLLLAVDNKQRLCEIIKSSSSGFSRDDCDLYLDTVRATRESSPDFPDWCKQGLESLTEDDWAKDLENSNFCCALVLELHEAGNPPELSTSFCDALKANAKNLLAGKHAPPQWIRDDWGKVLDCISVSGARKVLRDRLVEFAIAADGEVSDEFYEMYGAEITDGDSLARHDGILSHLLTVLVQKRSVSGLAWIESVFTKLPELLDSVEAEHTVEEFEQRLQDCVNSPQDDEAQAPIGRIAGLLGITPAVEEESVEDSENTSGTTEDSQESE